MPQKATQAPKWASLIVEGIEETVFSVDTNWRFTYLNHRAVNVLGRSKEALLGKVLWDAFPTLIGTKFEHIYRQAMAEGTPQHVEDFSLTTQSWYDVRAYPIPQGLIIYFQNITARKQAEAEIQRQSARAQVQTEVLRALAEVTHDYQSTVDTAARLLSEIIGDACLIRLLSPHGDTFELSAMYHPNPEAIALVRHILAEQQSRLIMEDLSGRVVLTGQSLLIPIVSIEQLKATTGPKQWAYFERFPIFSALVAPLRAAGGVIGAISMTRYTPGHAYTEDDLTLVQDLVDRIAIAILNARLLHQVQNELDERVQTEAALRLSEERFKTLSDATSEALVIHEQGKLIEVNQRAVELFGYTREELIGMAIERLIAPEHVTLLHDRIAQESAATVESIAVRKDGIRFITEARGRTIEYQGRRMRLGAIRDITNLKQAEAALRMSEARFTGIVNSAMDAIISVDEAQRIVVFNTAAEQMFRCTAPAVMGQPLDQFLPPAVRGLHAQHIHRFGQAGVTSRSMRALGALTAVRTTGETFPIEATISQTHVAGQPLYTVIIRDITERQRAEAQQAFLASIVESSEDAIIGKDLDGLILSWNTGAEALYGYTAEEVIGRPITLLVPPDLPDEVPTILDKIRQGKRILHYETRRVRKDATTVDVSLTISPIRDTTDTIIAASTIARNVTERKRLEAQLLQSQKMETIGHLVGGIAHDFNNILSAIIGFVGSAQAELTPDHPAQHDLHIAEDAAWRAAGLTRQLLAFARKQVVEPYVLNFNEVIVELDKLLRRLIGEDIELVTLPASDLGQVKADPGQIEQVIANLVVNSRDAMPHGGRLTIETANTVLDASYARQHITVIPGDYVMLAVSDTGIGMDAQVQQRIFEPFFTTKAVGRGTGLGLATCYGIVKQHGGNIWVYSEVGQGTTFKVYLPRVYEAVDARRGVADTAPLPRGTETVLLVEDEPLVREVTSRRLHEQGYTVLEANNGDDALRIIYAYVGAPIALLITDVVMPQMGGKVLAEQVTTIYPNIKVLFISGYAADAIVHHGRLAPGTNFLSKPFTPAAFARKVREVLDAAAANSPSHTMNR